MTGFLKNTDTKTHPREEVGLVSLDDLFRLIQANRETNLTTQLLAVGLGNLGTGNRFGVK